MEVTGLSVVRCCFDLADLAHSSCVIPGGASGDSRSRHFADQLESWRDNVRVPLHYLEAEVSAAAASSLTLTPAMGAS